MSKSKGVESKGACQLTLEEFKERIEAKLITRGGYLGKELSDDQIYRAIVYALKDILVEKRSLFKSKAKQALKKRICYLCMEFLVGRSLKETLIALGLYDHAKQIIEELGSDFDKVSAAESDPGLGNGGLGRLAACFMDSLSSLGYMANGYSILYENGLFRQKIVDGEQIELPDEWLESGGVWLVPHPELAVSVFFGGTVKERHDNGRFEYELEDYEEVRAIPYDLLVPGGEGGAVNTIRLWRSKSVDSGGKNAASGALGFFSSNRNSLGDQISRQLYPSDTFDDGKLLRISQQYFLVSASLQSIIRDTLAECGNLSSIKDKVAIHINDTHPALVIPELMRILMDIYSYSWDEAWGIVKKTVSYTNHTVLPEALECWRTDLFAMRLPRIYMIINEINRRFTEELWKLYPGDWDRISRMSVVAYNQVRMANLSIVGSHTVNGVSALHTDILKNNVFHDFYKLSPSKFINVTNGVSHRRWLLNSNPRLSSFLDELIGTEYRTDPVQLEKLKEYRTDSSALAKLDMIKKYNKESFASLAFERTGIRIDPDSLFDVQIKRMHEYKRQLLNVLKIISIYNKLINEPNAQIVPQTFIFGCKAAPGYVMAKRIIKLIYFLAKEINGNPIAKDKLKVVFLEDYNVSLAEILIPAADLSEQISLSGKEASGTGCMKLMMNGAPTIGTLDGANVEIMDAVGKDNFFRFGLNSREVLELWRNGYNPHSYYISSDEIKSTVDRLYSPIDGESFRNIGDYLIGTGNDVADPFMCLADFDSYVSVYSRALDAFSDTKNWQKKMLMNIASSGIFSSDIAIRKYAEKIWHIDPVDK